MVEEGAEVKATNVSDNFSTIIFMFAIVETCLALRILFAGLSVHTGAEGLMSLSKLLGLSGLVSLVAWIMMWVFRVRHAGEVCAGDFLTEEADTTGYLVSRGQLLWVLLMITWVFLSLVGLVCVCGCLFLILKKK